MTKPKNALGYRVTLITFQPMHKKTLYHALAGLKELNPTIPGFSLKSVSHPTLPINGYRSYGKISYLLEEGLNQCIENWQNFPKAEHNFFAVGEKCRDGAWTEQWRIETMGSLITHSCNKAWLKTIPVLEYMPDYLINRYCPSELPF